MDVKKKYVLLLLDGEEPSKDFIGKFVKDAAMVIATDGAARYADSLDVALDIVIGDMDSLSKDIRQKIEKKGTRIIEEVEQHSNDFEKALRYILSESSVKDIVVVGIHGKRADHVLTNFSVMLRYADRFDSLTAYDATHEHHFLTEEKHWYSFQFPVGTIISLTPLPEAGGVTTSGLYYPLKNDHMVFGRREGLSNIITSDEDATVEITKGALLISIPFESK